MRLVDDIGLVVQERGDQHGEQLEEGDHAEIVTVETVAIELLLNHLTEIWRWLNLLIVTMIHVGQDFQNVNAHAHKLHYVQFVAFVLLLVCVQGVSLLFVQPIRQLIDRAVSHLRFDGFSRGFQRALDILLILAEVHDEMPIRTCPRLRPSAEEVRWSCLAAARALLFAGRLLPTGWQWLLFALQV